MNEREAGMRRLKIKAWFLIMVLLLSVAGCGTLKEGAKRVMGISTKELEKGRKNALVKEMPYDYFTTYTKTLDILKQLNFYIYEQNIKGHMIAIYISESDTTPVGLFFKELDANRTQMEFSSPSTYAKEYVLGKISSAFEKLIKPGKQGDKIDAQKEVADK